MAQPQEKLPDRNLLHTESEMAMGAGAAVAAPEGEELARTRVSSPGRDAWRRFRRNWAAMLSLAVIVLLILLAILAPILHTAGATGGNDFLALNQGPSSSHWFGTDGVGADQYSRVLY